MDMQKEDKVLINSIYDKKKQCEDLYIPTFTAFLDPRQGAMAEAEFKFSKHIFYGGYEDAERRIMVFLPDYLNELDDENNPLEVLRLSVPKGSKKLSHRDYLGSILSLGINRNVTGDIIVRDDGADIIILKSMEEFLLSNYSKAGHTSFNTEIVPISDLSIEDVNFKEKRDTVASLRLDNLVSCGFNLSRGKAQEAIAGGIVFVNGVQCLKADKELSEGDKLVLRGKGKIVLQEVGKTTRKDRISIVLQIFV